MPAKPEPKTDALAGSVALSRLRVALSYGSAPDAEAVSKLEAKDPEGKLRVAVAKAMLGVPFETKAKPKAGDKDAPEPKGKGYVLEHLDALAKSPSALGDAAAYDAALLALDGAQLFGGQPTDPLAGATDPRKAYEAAIARLEAVAARKGLSPARAATAKKLAESAKGSLQLLDKPKAKESKP
jgi:hypothetical protein